MESPSRLRFVAAALLGILGVGSFVGIVVILLSQDPWAALAIQPLFVLGVVITVCALVVLSDALAAWLFAGLVTGVLVFVAVGSILREGMDWGNPVSLAVIGAAGGMVLVIVARAIEARRSRERDAGAIEAWRHSRNQTDR